MNRKKKILASLLGIFVLVIIGLVFGMKGLVRKMAYQKKARLSKNIPEASLLQNIEKIQHPKGNARKKDRNSSTRTLPSSPTVEDFEKDLRQNYELGMTHLQNHQYEKAEVFFREVLLADPTGDYARVAFTGLGFIEDERDHPVKAIKFYNKALKLKKDDPGLYRNLGISYEKSGQADLAESAFEHAIKYAPKNIDNYISLGNLFFKNKKTDRAISIFSKGLAKDSSSVELYYNRALAYMRKTRTDLAEKDFHKILELKPAGDIARGATSKLGDLMNLKRSPENSIVFYRKALSYDPHSVRILYNLGVAYVQNGEPEKASQSFQRALQFDSSHPDVLYSLGEIYYKYGFLDKAGVYLRKCLNIVPYHANASYLYASILEQSGKNKEALDIYTRLISLDPGNPLSRKSLLNIGLLYEQSGDYKKALESYLQADPNGSDTLTQFNTGILYQKMGLLDMSITALKKAISLDRTNPNFYRALGFVYSRQSIWEDATINFEKAEEAGARDVDIYLRLGYLYSLQEKYKKAEEVYGRAIRKGPTQNELIQIYNNLGIIYDKTARPREALQFFKRILALSPNNIEAHYNLALTYLHQKNYHDALAFLRATLALDPRHSSAHTRLGQIYYEKGLYEEAQKEFKTAVGLDASNIEAQILLKKIKTL